MVAPEKDKRFSGMETEKIKQRRDAMIMGMDIMESVPVVIAIVVFVIFGGIFLADKGY